MFWREIEVFVCRFLIEENEVYKDLLVVIKNHYPILRGCSLRSVKRVKVSKETVVLRRWG